MATEMYSHLWRSEAQSQGVGGLYSLQILTEEGPYLLLQLCSGLTATAITLSAPVSVQPPPLGLPSLCVFLRTLVLVCRPHPANPRQCP